MAEAKKTAPEAAKAEAKAEAKKTYTLRSSNKFLTVSELGVQFMNGKYVTSNPGIAKALLSYDGIELMD